MAGVKGRSGGLRPGAGRKPKPPSPELLQLLEEIRRAQRTQDVHLTHLVRQTERDPLLRRLTELERAVGLIEKPQTPRHTRRRPLGAE
jgi:hypothetical protein